MKRKIYVKSDNDYYFYKTITKIFQYQKINVKFWHNLG